MTAHETHVSCRAASADIAVVSMHTKFLQMIAKGHIQQVGMNLVMAACT